AALAAADAGAHCATEGRVGGGKLTVKRAPAAQLAARGTLLELAAAVRQIAGILSIVAVGLLAVLAALSATRRLVKEPRGTSRTGPEPLAPGWAL
ncbi:MAG: hypothetical protein ACE5JM_14910, partial [Armatimonadota bacterium]